jgi:hypothetical protein
MVRWGVPAEAASANAGQDRGHALSARDHRVRAGPACWSDVMTLCKIFGTTLAEDISENLTRGATTSGQKHKTKLHHVKMKPLDCERKFNFRGRFAINPVKNEVNTEIKIMRISSTNAIKGGRVLYTIGRIEAASPWHPAHGSPLQENWRALVLRELMRKAEDIDADAIIRVDYQNDGVIRINETA